MSRGARIAIAIVCALFGASFAASAAARLLPDVWGLLALSGICWLGMASCIEGNHKIVASRIIAAVIFFTYVAYVISEASHRGKMFSWSLSEPCLMNALRGLFFWGLPAGYYMIYGRLPVFQRRLFENDKRLTIKSDESGNDEDTAYKRLMRDR